MGELPLQILKKWTDEPGPKRRNLLLIHILSEHYVHIWSPDTMLRSDSMSVRFRSWLYTPNTEHHTGAAQQLQWLLPDLPHEM
jgi:hypothetical protein